PLDDAALGLVDVQAVEVDLVVGAVDGRPVARVGLALPALGRLDGADDRQVEDLGEGPVPLVLAGDGHDGAGAVAHQDVVGDEHGDPLAGGRVDGEAAQEDAGLLAGLDLALDVGAAGGPPPVGGDGVGRAVVAPGPQVAGRGRDAVVRPLRHGQLLDQRV